ncbi:hypothetical protein AFCA_006343 [Aspergillus flavus]|nr:hypothetical protein AFCA_006343 [Aspergillus flavus]
MTLRPFSRAPSFLSDEPEKPLLSVLKWCCIDLENGLPLPLDNTFKLGAPLKAALANIKVENGAAHHYELHDITSSDFPDVSDTSAESADSKALAVSIVVPSSQIKNQRQYRWSILQTILETEPAYQELEEAIEQSITDLAEAIVPPEATIEDKITTDRFPTLHPMLPKDKQTSLEASLKEFLPKQAKSNTTELQAKVKALLVDTNITDKIAALALQIEAHKADKGRALERNTKGLAERIVKEGTDKALAGIPTARFGSLMTADRQEKESFRAIANLEDGHQRPLGSAIFVFIGGTCSTFEDFTTDLATKDAKDAKKPDFVSRLRGFVNIQGSHQSPRDTDYMYLVRRGIHLRAMLQNRLGCKADEEIQLDDGVLNALLTVLQFRHGARSLESIISMSQLHGQKIFRRSALPSAQQLGLHVDYTTFVESFEPENHRAIARAKIAEKIRILGQLPPEDDFRQRIAGQILDMIYNNGAYLVPQPPNESSPEDAEEHPKRKALVNDLAKYRYYAVNLHNSIYAWGADTPADRDTYITATKSLLELLKECGFAVRKGS